VAEEVNINHEKARTERTMRTLERAMTTGEEALAARYAAECARTLRKYHDAESDPDPQEQRRRVDLTWALHRDAINRFEQTFPRLEWRDFVKPALLDALRRSRP
jgi:hypothetical protein